MTGFVSGRSILSRILAAAACALVLGQVQIPVVRAQHGGGHVGGGAHVSGGGGHLSGPHVSAPVSPASVSRPVVSSGPSPAGVGIRSFVAAPPAVRLISPAGTIRPILGNHVGMMPPLALPQIVTPGAGGATQTNVPVVVIGFPPVSAAPPITIRNSRVLSFSGQGHEIWQNPTNSTQQSRANGPVSGRHEFAGGIPQATHPHSSDFRRRPIHPVRPVFPIFRPPVFGFFGAPFVGFGLGFGFNSLWWPTCGPFWSWGFGCNALPLYDYGYGNYGAIYGPGGLGTQMEGQSEPQVYENPSPPASLYLPPGEGRELVQLYLKDGTIYSVTDYWLVNDQLHFTTIDAGGTQSSEQVIGFDRLDLQKTIDVNTNRGFRFVLRNEPLQQYLQDYPENEPSGAGPPQAGPDRSLSPPAPPEQPPQVHQP